MVSSTKCSKVSLYKEVMVRGAAATEGHMIYDILSLGLSERTDLGSERPDSRSRKPEGPDSKSRRPEGADLSSESPEFWSRRPGLGLNLDQGGLIWGLWGLK